MHQIKGFYNVDGQTNNTPDTVAIFGELSSKSRTYGRDIKEYSNLASPKVKFTLFSSKSADVEIDISTQATDTILTIGNWIYDLKDAVTPNTTSSGLATMILNNFNTFIQQVGCGPIIFDGIRRLPTWISYRLKGLSEETEVKIWLNDNTFLNEYDEYIINIIPPFENIDQFFMPVQDLKELVASVTPISITDRINEVRGLYPDTYLRAEATNYINPNNPTDQITVYWYASIHGKAGDDSNVIRQAIMKYISSNSNSAETEWKGIIPDLFNATAFYILPRWDKYAIPTRRTIPGIYSPVSGYKEVFDFMKQKLTGIVSTSHLENNLEITTHRYKSLTLGIVGGEDNRNNLAKLTNYFADYIGEETTNEDFNRQSELTKQWTNMITEMLYLAENYENNPNLPSSIRLVSRNGLSFLVRKLDNIEYYVALKSNYSS